MRVRCTTPALDDFKAISHRIEQERNLETANRVCRTIYNAIQVLRRHPRGGRPSNSEEATRELVIPQSPYLVAYRIIEPQAIQILRIWHGAPG